MFEKKFRFLYESAFWARYDSSRPPLVNYSTLPTSRNRGPGLESETCGSVVWKVRPHRRTHRPVTRTLMTLRDRVLADICARWALHSRVYNEVRSVSLSLFLTNTSTSLFFSAESQPPGRATELIDCALQIDFEQKVSTLARRPRRGWARPVPDPTHRPRL